MDMIDRWPQLKKLIQDASAVPNIEAWLFGSALRTESPADIDVLLIYGSRAQVKQIRDADDWPEYDPPIHIIAMTAEEEAFYSFKRTTGAIKLAD